MITTTFVTRYVRDHDAAVAWYTELFGRPADRSPLPNCREWDLGTVAFQVIDHPERAGEQSFAFVVDDLDGEVDRLAGIGLRASDAFDVNGLNGVRYREFTDPEQVRTGLVGIDAG